MKQTDHCHRDFFHQHHLKNTPARDMVIHLLEIHQPITLDQLFTLIKKTKPAKQISHSTVFRILEQFLKVEIIEKVSLEIEATPFYQIKDHHHHHQLVCTNCKKIITTSECPLGSFEISLAKKHQFQLHHHQLTLYGLCADCHR